MPTKKKLRILIVTPFFPPAWSYGGPVRVTYDHARELAKREHNITVATTDVLDAKHRFSGPTSIITKMENFSVIRFRNVSNFLAKRNLHLPIGFSKWLQKNITNFDLVHLHDFFTQQNIISEKLCQKKKIPFVLTTHGVLDPYRLKILAKPKKIFLHLYKNILNNADKILALTEKEKKDLENLGTPAEKITIVPNGISKETQPVEFNPTSFLKKYDVQDQKFFLFLGRIHKIKGVDILIKTFAKITHHFPEYKLVIAGPDEGFLTFAKKMAQDLKLQNKIIFTGILAGAEKMNAFKSAKLFIMPSVHEPFGLVALEAGFLGTPVIIMKNSGLAPTFAKYQAGLLAKTNKDDLAQKIEEALNNPTQTKKYAANLQQLIHENFTTAKIAEKLEKIYLKIIQLKT